MLLKAFGTVYFLSDLYKEKENNFGDRYGSAKQVLRATLLTLDTEGLFPQSVGQEGVELYLHILILNFVA